MAAPKELLKRVPLFKGLDDKQIDMLSRTFTERTFTAGEEITSEGGGGVGFFVIEDGEAVVTRRRRGAAHARLGRLLRRDRADRRGPRTSTITAKTDVRCYGLTPWQFRPLVEENATIAWPMLARSRSGYASAKPATSPRR